MNKYIVIAILSGAITVAISGVIEQNEISNLKDVLAALLNVSSIVFAIIGAWIAIIYPKALSVTFTADTSKTGVSSSINQQENDTNYLSELVEIVMVSAVVLIAVISIQFLASLNGQKMANLLGKASTKHGVFLVLIFCTLAQINCVWRVILANYFFLNELRRKSNRSKAEFLGR